MYHFNLIFIIKINKKGRQVFRWNLIKSFKFVFIKGSYIGELII